MATFNPRHKWVLPVGREPVDPALNDAAAGFGEAILRYARLRTQTALDAIPRREGQSPRLWRVRHLTREAMEHVRRVETPGAAYEVAFRYGVDGCRDANGVVDLATTNTPPWLTDDAFEDAVIALGWGGVNELGRLVIEREQLGDYEDTDDAKAPKSPFARYSPPPGLPR